MNKTDIIQTLVNGIKAITYLEIGVERGDSFFQIKAPRKIGVDIKFRIIRSCISGRKKILKKYLQNLKSNIFNRYYQMSSDYFFRKHSKLFKKRKIDIAFIDGLHEYNQVIRDVNNCLNNLNNNGIIVLHDCNPKAEKVTRPRSEIMGEITERWMGDVWKAIVYFRSCRDDLNVFVLDADSGIGIITKGRPERLLTYSMDDITNLSYRDLEKNRVEMLNLKSQEQLENFPSNFLEKPR